MNFDQVGKQCHQQLKHFYWVHSGLVVSSCTVNPEVRGSNYNSERKMSVGRLISKEKDQSPDFGLRLRKIVCHSMSVCSLRLFFCPSGSIHICLSVCLSSCVSLCIRLSSVWLSGVLTDILKEDTIKTAVIHFSVYQFSKLFLFASIQVQPPWKPDIKSDTDTKYIPDEFANEPVQLTPPEHPHRQLASITEETADMPYFQSFSYHGSRGSLDSYLQIDWSHRLTEEPGVSGAFGHY